MQLCIGTEGGAGESKGETDLLCLEDEGGHPVFPIQWEICREESGSDFRELEADTTAVCTHRETKRESKEKTNLYLFL